MNIDILFTDQDRHVRFLLGLYIKRKRNERGMSISELASRVYVTQESLKRIESGKKNLSPGDLAKFQDQLNFEYGDLIEIHKIAKVAYVNDISKVMVPDYPA